jgi:hypothetical protein
MGQYLGIVSERGLERKKEAELEKQKVKVKGERMG